MGKADLSVFHISVDHPAVFPAAKSIHQGLGALEVVEGDKRLDPFFQQIVDQLIVEGQPFGVWGAGGVGHDPAPGKAHPVDLEAQLGHQVHIFFPVVIVVGGHFGIGDAGTDAAVGGGGALTALVIAALYLKSTGGSAPKKAFGKMMYGLIHRCFLLLVRSDHRR